MKIDEIAERIELLPSGGFLSSDNRFDRNYVYSLIDSAAAQAKRNEFARTKRIHNSWLFPIYPEFVESAQISSCRFY